MKLLHTSDWHVGKQARGISRAEEFRSVLAEIGDVAEQQQVDAILIAGDLFDTAAPTAQAEEIVYRTLLRCSAISPVVVISGNHDNARKLQALRPLLQRCEVTMIAEPQRPDDGGVVTITTANGALQIAALPFVSQRGIVRAEQLMSNAAFENAQAYSQRLITLIALLTSGFHADAVNVVLAHAFVVGGQAGGGERAGHLSDEYSVTNAAFPMTASYVALGHLHRAQRIAGSTAIHYCGSPLQLDFGEKSDPKQVNLVTVEAGLPSSVEPIMLHSGRAMRTYRGTVDQLREAVIEDDAWLRLIVTEPQRSGLGDQVRAIFGERAIEIRVDAPASVRRPASTQRVGRSAHELFAEFLGERGVVDGRLNAVFDDLLEQVESSDR